MNFGLTLDLYDMHGNVWQWCLDGPRGYDKKAVKDPLGPENDGRHVLHGGSWNDEARYCRDAYSPYWGQPACRRFDIGFRVLALPLAETP